MAIFVQIRDFVEDSGGNVQGFTPSLYANFTSNTFYTTESTEFNFDTDQLAVALSNIAPEDESSDPTILGNAVLSNVTEIDYTNCSSRDITTVSWDAGTNLLVL